MAPYNFTSAINVLWTHSALEAFITGRFKEMGFQMYFHSSASSNCVVLVHMNDAIESYVQSQGSEPNLRINIEP